MAIFTHDCMSDCCKYAGSTNEYDVYLSRSGTLIIRFGNNGPDYFSYPKEIVPMLLNKDHKIKMAWDLVVRANLHKEEVNAQDRKLSNPFWNI